MKKIIALTALAVVLTAASDASAFKNGFRAGANLSYASVTSKQKVNEANPKGYTFSDHGPVLTLEGNYGTLDCNIYKAIDIRLGWTFIKGKEEDAQLKEGFTSGIGFRLGTPLNEKSILFGRLALDANQQKFSYKFNGKSRKDTYFDYALAPGIGLTYELSDTMGLDVLYQYSMSFATRGYNGNEHKFSKTPSAHHLGMGFSIRI